MRVLSLCIASLLFFACRPASVHPTVDDDEGFAPFEDTTARGGVYEDFCGNQHHEPAEGDTWVLTIPVEPYQPCVQGLVEVRLDAAAGRFDARVEFFEVDHTRVQWEEATVHLGATGPDTCRVVEVSGFGIAPDVYGITWSDEGRVLLAHDNQQVGLDSQEIPPVVDEGARYTYEGRLGDLGLLPVSGEPFHLTTVDGLQWPMLRGEAPELPEPLALLHPDFDADPTLPRADVELEWNGRRGGTLEVEISAWPVQIACAVTDDGSFTLPGAALQHLPPNASATVRMTRRHEGEVEASDGRVLRTVLESVATASVRIAP